MKNYASVFIFAFLLLGCSPKTIVMTDVTKQNISNKTFSFTNRSKPASPFVMTPSKALVGGLTGGIGAAIMVATDDNMNEENVTKTPSSYLNAKLVKTLTQDYKLTLVENNKMIDTQDIDKIIAQYSGVDYILDNHTYFWQVVYFPTHFGTYRVMLYNTMKLIDTKDKKVIAQTVCEYNPDYADDMPTYDQMFENDNLILKRQTKEALDKCLTKIKSEIFSSK